MANKKAVAKNGIPMKDTLKKDDGIPFTQIANVVLNNTNLSHKAKGVFCYIYSKPQDWDFSADRIAQSSTDGEKATRAALQELEEAGYLTRQRLKTGRMSYYITWRPESQTPETGVGAEVGNGKQPKGQTAKTGGLSNKDSYSNKDKESNKESAPNGAVAFIEHLYFGKKHTDSATPMSLQEFVLLSRASAHRYIRIIAEYADERKLSFETRGQWREFGRRNIQSAKRLSPFNDRQIGEAIKRINRDEKEKGGFISKWGLETVEKYLEK